MISSFTRTEDPTLITCLVSVNFPPSCSNVFTILSNNTVFREFIAAVPTLKPSSLLLAATDLDRCSPPAFAITDTRFDWLTADETHVLPMLIPNTILKK